MVAEIISWIGVSVVPNKIGAVLDALVVLQSHLKRLSNQRGALRGPISYPPVLAALKTALRALEVQKQMVLRNLHYHYNYLSAALREGVAAERKVLTCKSLPLPQTTSP